MTIDEYMAEYEVNKDNPVLLSDLGIRLASELFTHSTKVAQSELLEKSEVVRLLTPQGEEKKLSVSESETKAIVSTLNVYGLDKINLEAGYEVLNMFKTRIRVLTQEMEKTQ